MTSATASPSANHLAIEDLDRAIVDLSARINAATAELLALIREFDERAGFLKWGFANCTDWLHWRCDLSLNAAREKVRVAHALKSLPQMSTAFERGMLSYSKVRALTRVATEDNEAMLIAFSLTTTAARVEERCRQMRNVQPGNGAEAHRVYQQRALRVWRDAARGTLTLTVELPFEQGEMICRALDKAVEDCAGNGAEHADTSWHAQQADALVTLAQSYLAGVSASGSSSAENYEFVIHVDETALSGGAGRSDLPLESMRRLSCDGSVVAMTDGPRGEPLNVGRQQRTVTTAIKRALWARDGGCSFPGCAHTRFVDAHHVKHWSQGGETSVANTMLQCSSHHRLVHEGGYTIHKDARGRWYFRRPDGRALPTRGYQPQDMIDDDDANTSAEVYAAQHEREHDGVRERHAEYRNVRNELRHGARCPALTADRASCNTTSRAPASVAPPTRQRAGVRASRARTRRSAPCCQQSHRSILPPPCATR